MNLDTHDHQLTRFHIFECLSENGERSSTDQFFWFGKRWAFHFVYFALLGVGYIFMGQLLDAYHIRKADQRVFFVGGSWSLSLVSMIPCIPVLRERSLAVFGVERGTQHVVSYIYRSKT